MKKLIYLLLIVQLICLNSCDILKDVAKNIEQEMPLSESEVASGLREALRVSTDTAVNVVSAVNGYYKDKLIKIMLPEEAHFIADNMNNPLLKAVGITKLIDDVIVRMNRAAENAAVQATPIFVNAIKSMTIKDAFNILNGNDTAATHYFRQKTYYQLKNSFKPKIRKSLGKPIMGGVSANKAWSDLTGAYNQVAQVVPNWKKVNTKLDDYVTSKALNGLFIKVAEQEKQIRRDPMARVTEILRRVFG